jgi:hypothetical protein
MKTAKFEPTKQGSIDFDQSNQKYIKKLVKTLVIIYFLHVKNFKIKNSNAKLEPSNYIYLFGTLVSKLPSTTIVFAKLMPLNKGEQQGGAHKSFLPFVSFLFSLIFFVDLAPLPHLLF